MKKSKIIYSLFCLVSYVMISHADDHIKISNSPSFYDQTSMQAKLTISTDPFEKLAAEENKSAHSRGILSGVMMISGGAALYMAGHFLGSEYYEKYKKSAFTENTDKLRKKVVVCNAMRIGGGVLGGAGLLVLVLSF